MNIIFVDISGWISIRIFFTSDTTCPRRHWSRESRFFKILFFFYFFKFQFWFGFGAGDSWSRESSNSIPTRAVSQSHTAIGKMNGDGRRPDLFGESKPLRIDKEEFILKNFNLYLRIYPRIYSVKWPGINGPLNPANIIVPKNLLKGSFNPDD